MCPALGAISKGFFFPGLRFGLISVGIAKRARGIERKAFGGAIGCGGKNFRPRAQVYTGKAAVPY